MKISIQKRCFNIIFFCTLMIIASNSSLASEKLASSPLSSSQSLVSSEREILDEARKGVVIIKTLSHASAYSSEGQWAGTGFIVDKEAGLIVTNRHVAGEMTVGSYEVKFTNGRTVEAKLKYYDPLYDFAFLYIDPKKFPPETRNLEFDPQAVDMNDPIFMITNAAGEEFSSYKGTVYSIYENVGPYPEQTFKFSGITIGGASGSPIFSIYAKVVGILYGGQFVTGAALPIDYVKESLHWLKQQKIPPRKSLGIVPEYLDLDLAIDAGFIPEEVSQKYRQQFPKANNRVLVINNRIVNSSARKVLQPGDIIWTLEGTWIGPQLQLIDQIVNDIKKDEVVMEVYRAGKLISVKLTPYDLHAIQKDQFVTFAGAAFYEHNELVKLTTGDDKGGVYISHTSDTSAFRPIAGQKGMFSAGGFAQNDRVKILQIENQPLQTLDDLWKILPELSKKKTLTVRYIDYVGGAKFGNIISGDRQERIAILRYEPKFDKPTHYRFNSHTPEWDTKSINK